MAYVLQKAGEWSSEINYVTNQEDQGFEPFSSDCASFIPNINWGLLSEMWKT